MEQESNWKVFGYNNFYRINTDGVVQTILSRGNKHSIDNTADWRTLSQSKGATDKHGGFYLSVSIKTSNNPSIFKPIRVHRLVAEQFIGKIGEGMEVDHIDGDRTNNKLNNLRIVSHAENIKNAKQRGVFDKGQNAFKGKLKKEQIKEIQSLISNGLDNAGIAKIYGIDKSNISRVRTGAWQGLKYL